VSKHMVSTDQGRELTWLL